jgi:hypothetical protein
LYESTSPSYILQFVWFIFLGAFFEVLVDLLVLDLEMEEGKYIKTVIFSLKYDIIHMFKSYGKY